MSEFWLKARRGFLGLVYPISNSVSSVHAPWSRKKIRSAHYRYFLKMLRPGDVLLTFASGELTNLCIPGFWSHACIYAGDEKVIEAVSDGVLVTDLIDATLSKDYVMIRRPNFATADQMSAAVAWARSKLGAEYDFFFNKKNQAFYCSELVWLAYEAACGGDVPFTLRKTLGLDTVIPDDIGLADKYWRTIADSRTVPSTLLKSV